MAITRKELDRRRENRLWLTQIGIPLITTAVTLLTIPEVRYSISERSKQVKIWFKSTFKKESN